MSCFVPADILLPQGVDMEKWAVIACDQFTSEPEYWQRVRRRVGDAPSSLHLILPEAELRQEPETRIAAIHAAMEDYESRGLFRCCPRSFVYVERQLSDGSLRRGLVGMLDLEDYDYHSGTDAPVRATERTVLERIPPRVKIREGASLELPHVLLLCDDEEDSILAPLAGRTDMPAYDFPLMEGGGAIRGWLLSGAEAVKLGGRIAAYEERQRLACGEREPMLYAVGDGNHSLAAAKAAYETIKQTLGVQAAAAHPARWALVELENLRDGERCFAPIHRLIRRSDPRALLDAARRAIGGEDGAELRWFSGREQGTLRLRREPGRLPVALLQDFLDDYLAARSGDVDYIHGDESLMTLAREEGSLGFLLPEVEKADFFRGVMTDGALPRKTFSMGQARDKRYYLEARKIR